MSGPRKLTGALRLAAGVACLAAASSAQAAAPAGEWWSASFRYRQRVSIVASTTAIPAQYSIRLQLDHAALAGTARSLATGDDLRVVYWSGSGWVELDRRLDDDSTWNGPATQLWFRTQAAIGATTTDDNYYLYYGFAGAGSPPTNWANVFLFHDDFGDGVFDAARWICSDPLNLSPPAVCAESAGTMSLQSDTALFAAAAYAFGTDTRWESRLRLATNFATTIAYNYFGASDYGGPGSPYTNDWFVMWADTVSHQVETADTGIATTGVATIATPNAYHVYTVDREGTASVRFRQDGTQVGNITTRIPDANLRLLVFNDDPASPGQILDWVRVRKYVTPEPTTALSAPEPGPSEMRVLSGTYTGNGVDNRAIVVGFQPDVVIVDRFDPASPITNAEAVIRTTTMAGDASKSIDDASTGGLALAPNLIQSLDPQGFTIGTDNNVNQNGLTYYWIAFEAAPGQLALGTYGGTGAVQDVTSVGFMPAYLLAMSSGPRNVVQKSSSMPAAFSQDFISLGYTTAVLDLLPGGFRVGTDPTANENGALFHYVAWGSVPGKVAVGSYSGNSFDNRDITGAGFLPEWVVVSRSSNGAGAQLNAPAHKPAASGISTDAALLFGDTRVEADNMQRLQLGGFQVGTHPRVNSLALPSTYHWAAFGPHLPKVHYRSIGTALPYGTGTVTVTNGSAAVAGTGTGWLAANRGRGDVLTLPCPDPPACTGGVHYTVKAVTGAGALELTTPYAGLTGSFSYLLRRQFATFAEWEDCIDGPPGAACSYFPVASASLVADDRSEVGVVYKDTLFTLASPVDIDGSTTDAVHTITLTADASNRHLGLDDGGVAIDNTASSVAFRVRDDHVTLEWLEIEGGSGPGADAIEVDNLSAANQVVLRLLLLHDTGGRGIDIRDSDANADVYDNFVYRTNGGIVLDAGSFAGTIRLLANTVFSASPGTGIESRAAGNSTVTLRNNVAHSTSPDFAVPGPNGASSHNLSGDGTAPGTSAITGASLAAVAFVSTAVGSENLHLTGSSVAVDSGADLSASFGFDIDAGLRTTPWDRGADDFSAAATTDLAITKTDGATTAVPGAAISYTITVTNNGPGAVTSLFVNDPVPAAIQSPVFTPSTGFYSPGTGEWTGLNLAATQSVTLTLAGTIDPTARGTLTNTATVSPPPGITDSNTTNDSAGDTDTLTPSVDVSITKADSPDAAQVGGVLTYVLTVTNAGPSSASGISASDPLPATMALDGPAGGAIVPSQGACNYDSPTHTVSCVLGGLLPAQSATVTIRVRPGSVGSFTNTASVTRTEPDTQAANDSDAETTTVEVSTLGLRFLTATSSGQRNVLEWVNPADADYVTTEIMVRTDAFPTGPGDPLATSLYNANGGGSGGRMKLVHGLPAPPLTNGQTYFYGAFVHRAVVPLVSPGRFVTGRPFDHTAGPVKWAFSTGATALAAPTVGGAGVIATSNDRGVYAMQRGTDADFFGIDSGEWPAAWRPIELGGPVQQRPPVIPLPVGASNPVAYLGAQDGRVYVVDAAQGGSVGFPWPPALIGPMVQAAPAGIFPGFGGSRSYLLVGTRDGSGPNAFVALDPQTGAVVDSWNNGGAGPGAIGIVSGMAAVDYGPPPRVYFTSRAGQPVGSTNTVWCFDLPAAAPIFSTNLTWVRQLGDIDSSPVLRDGRVYVGTPLGVPPGTLYSIDAIDGNNTALDRTFAHNDGQVRGFVWPDRASGDLYFATNSLVWGVTDTGAALVGKFAPISLGPGVTPSAVLFTPASHYVYVGGSDGKLYEIDVLPAVPTVKSVTLGNGLSVVGAPSLDIGFLPNLVLVGTEAGIFYAVQVPLP